MKKIFIIFSVLFLATTVSFAQMLPKDNGKTYQNVKYLSKATVQGSTVIPVWNSGKNEWEGITGDSILIKKYATRVSGVISSTSNAVTLRNKIVEHVDSTIYFIDYSGNATVIGSLKVTGSGSVAEIKRYTAGTPTVTDTGSYSLQQWGKTYSYYDSTVNAMVKINRPLTIRDFGAVDGIVSSGQRTINSTAMRNYMNYYSFLHVPKGIWQYDSSIVLMNGNHIIAETKDSSVLQYFGQYFAISSNFTSFVSIKNVTILGKSTSDFNVAGGIYFKNVTYATIHDVIISGQGGLSMQDGLLLEGANPYNLFNITVKDCRFFGLQNWALHLKGDGTGTLLNFSDCAFETSGANYNGNNGNVYIECASSFLAWNHLNFTNCNFQGSAGYPFICEGSLGLTLKSCYWEQNAPVTRPLVWLGRPPFHGVGGTYISDLIIEQSNMGIDTVAVGLGIVHIVGDCDVNGSISSSTVTTPIYNTPFLSVSNNSRIELIDNGFGSVGKYLYNGGISSTKTVIKTSPRGSIFKLTNGTVIPFGRTTFLNNSILSTYTDTSIVMSDITLKRGVTEYSESALDVNANGLNLLGNGRLGFATNTPNLIANSTTGYTGSASFEYYDHYSLIAKIGSLGNSFFYKTRISAAGVNDTALVLDANLYPFNGVLQAWKRGGVTWSKMDSVGRLTINAVNPISVPNLGTGANTDSMVTVLNGILRKYPVPTLSLAGLSQGAATDSIVSVVGGVAKKNTINNILSSTTNTLRVPRLTNAQIGSINGGLGAFTGDILYNSTENRYQFGTNSGTWSTFSSLSDAVTSQLIIGVTGTTLTTVINLPASVHSSRVALYKNGLKLYGGLISSGYDFDIVSGTPIVITLAAPAITGDRFWVSLE